MLQYNKKKQAQRTSNTEQTAQTKQQTANFTPPSFHSYTASIAQLKEFVGEPKKDIPTGFNPVQAFGLSTESYLDKDPRGNLPAYKHQPIQKKENKTGLPDNLKSGVESLSGMSMDDVKVHYNSSKPSQLQAHAFAQGTDIHVASGQEKHLPHEAWHVAQQKQGRVKPTTQMNGVAVNDDKGLEREADVMGGKANTLQKKENNLLVPTKTSSSSNIVQAIMSVVDFQAATPKKFLKPRNTVTVVDAALNTYILNKTAVNAQNLYTVSNNYANGNHDAGRKVVARQLADRANAEFGLLQEIGNGNAFLIDALINQVGIVRITPLTILAHHVTAAKATILPNLINVLGVGNLGNPALIPLITAVGVGNLDLLPVMITQSGGIGQMVNLAAVINHQHAGHGDLAFDLTREAGGNAVDFTRLAGEVPTFQQTGPPGGIPPSVTLAVNAYNAAIRPAAVTALTNLHAAAITARAEAVTFGGVNIGLLNGVQARITAINNRILALNANAGLAVGAAETNPATQLRNIVANALNNAITNQGLGVLSLAQTNALANFNNAMATVNNENTALQNAAGALTIQGVNFDHFLVRHTSHYFDFGDIKTDNTQWNTALGAGVAAQVEAKFNGVLANLAANGNWLRPGVPVPNQPVAGGGTAQIAGLAVVGGIRVGQFFPEANPGAGNHDHPDTTMRAIYKLL